MEHWPSTYLGGGQYHKLRPGESGQDLCTPFGCPYCGAEEWSLKYYYDWDAAREGWTVEAWCDMCGRGHKEEFIPAAAPGQAK